MTIYVDTLFCLNWAINYLLLLASRRISGGSLQHKRLLAAAAMGAAFAVATVIPKLSFFTAPGMKLLTLLVMIWCAFGTNRRAIKEGALFLGLSFAFCGVIMLVVVLTGRGLMLVEGAAYYCVGAQELIFTAAGVYCGAYLLFSRLAEHTGKALATAIIRLGNNQVSIRALRDTGNTLKDPVSNEPVLVADRQVLQRLLPEDMRKLASEQSLCHPIELIPSLVERQLACRLIPFRTVGISSGLLLAIRCDELTLDGKPARSRLVAFSPTAVSDGGGYEALTGGM